VLRALLGRGVEPHGLAAREAIALLQLATGPLRVLDEHWEARTLARIRLAESALGRSTVP
jgi:hypothetical protein